MSDKHTPGPWAIKAWSTTYDGGFTGSGHQVVSLTSDGEIAIFSTTEDAEGEDAEAEREAADLRLIAAAPELLAALRDLERVAGIASGFDDPERVAARAAIAKAA